MKNRMVLAVLSVCSVLVLSPFSAEGAIYYQLQHIDGNTWKYDYEIHNNELAIPIRAFTIWFDEDFYENLEITSSESVRSSWAQDFLISVPVFGNGFDSYAETATIEFGENLGGFSVNFDWLGTGSPGQQPFDIVDNVTFETIYNGTTVPEPSSILLMFGLAILQRSRKSNRTLLA